MNILGVDASTKTIGWAFSNNGIIKYAGFVDISNIKSNKDKCIKFIIELNKFNFIKCIDYINLEEALYGFRFGRTKQQTIIKLAKFNAILEYILTEYYKIPVNLCSVNTLRVKLFGKCRIKNMSSKEFVKLQLESNFPYIKKFNISNSRGMLDIRNNDMYDAIVCALYTNINTNDCIN